MRDEFAQVYAHRSGVTVEWLSLQGREVRFCNCGDADCPGWQMAHVREDTIFDLNMRAHALVDADASRT